MISEKHLQDVCMAHCGSKTCRYLYNDELDPNQWHCNKLRPIEKSKIDNYITNFIKDCSKRKVNPKKLNQPLGDNCEGLLLLKNIKQGYDCED
jgi:hypothetical protein